MAYRVLLLLLLLAGFTETARADEPCPESCTINLGAMVCTNAAARDSSSSIACDPYGTIETHASYDLVTGQVLASVQGCLMGPIGAGALARDRFKLVGPSGGPPITFQAQLSTDGGVGGFGFIFALISEIGGESRTARDDGQGYFGQQLVLPLIHAVGEEFELHYEAHANTDGFGWARAFLSFGELPAGYGVASCQGFAGQGTVPVRRTTWGALKSHYR